MMDDFKEFLELPGTPQEQEWLKEQLETLSVRESYALAAVSMGYPPEKAADAIKSILSLPDCTLHPAGSYEDLGKYSQKGAASLPEDVLPYVDFDHIGQEFEDEHPGLFIGGYYVEYPKKAAEPAYSGKNAFLPEDSDWSVKLKLASPAVPEGVWLRLPGYDGKMAEDADEVVLALDELRVKSLEDCTLLEARCILPEAGDLTKQYSSITDLVRDGDNLGYVLAEQGQGKAHWLDKFAAALEYEDCRTLKFALDISQNLRCYEWVPSSGIKEFAANNLRSCGVPEELIQSGNIDLDAYAEDLLERQGRRAVLDDLVNALRGDSGEVPGDKTHAVEQLPHSVAGFFLTQLLPKRKQRGSDFRVRLGYQSVEFSLKVFFCHLASSILSERGTPGRSAPLLLVW